MGNLSMPIAFDRATSSSYNYNVPATVSSISGSWSGSMMEGANAVSTITSSGGIVISSSGCTTSGVIQPRSNGKNIFDVSMTNGPSPCNPAGAAVRGIAVKTLPTTTISAIYIMYVNDSRTVGKVFFAAK